MMLARSLPFLQRVTAPDASPVTLAQAKSQVRVDSSDDDAIIRAYLAAATEAVDGPRGFLGRALVDQTWDYYLDRFPVWRNPYIDLPLPPMISVTGVFYRDSSGAEQTLSPLTYSVSSSKEPGRLYLPSSAAWPTIAAPSPNAVRIRFRAGYPDGEVPAGIIAAILILFADMYEHRTSQVVGESASVIPWSAMQLLKPHRFYLGMA